MILKDFVEIMKISKVTGTISGEALKEFILGEPTWWHDRYIIDYFDGIKIERNKFRSIEDIPEKLLTGKVIKWNLILGTQDDGFNRTTIEFTVAQ
jgi:hypothetical protein